MKVVYYFAFVGIRDGVDLAFIQRAFRQVNAKYPNFTLVSGGARGVDTQSAQVAVANGNPVLTYDADWKGKRSAAATLRAQAKGHDPVAGFARNSCILGLHTDCAHEANAHTQTHGVVAFTTAASKGTRDTIHKALVNQIPVWLIEADSGKVLKECPCDKPEKAHAKTHVATKASSEGDLGLASDL